MEISENMIPLILELESAIGDECYNSKSYNGWTKMRGCAFRYPVTFTAKDGDTCKEHYIYPEYFNCENIMTLRYAFGANSIFVGKGIVNVLDILEERYGLDFNELERLREEKTPNSK